MHVLLGARSECTRMYKRITGCTFGLCYILGCGGGDCEDYCLLGCDTVQSFSQVPEFGEHSA